MKRIIFIIFVLICASCGKNELPLILSNGVVMSVPREAYKQAIHSSLSQMRTDNRKQSVGDEAVEEYVVDTMTIGLSIEAELEVGVMSLESRSLVDLHFKEIP